uniref:Uncharacterized protein n=1 Tax=Magallana gigas TaxID=29159 RepID=A0A8W8IEJ3_MAGGI
MPKRKPSQPQADVHVEGRAAYQPWKTEEGSGHQGSATDLESCSDLALLLKNSNIEDTVSERVLVVGNDGQMVSSSRTAIKSTSIEKWTDAFLIYVSVFTSVHVSNFQDMLKYMHDVRTGADRSAGWKLYGEQFRFKIAMYPDKSWTSVDCVITVLCPYMCQIGSPIQPKTSIKARTSTRL